MLLLKKRVKSRFCSFSQKQQQTQAAARQRQRQRLLCVGVLGGNLRSFSPRRIHQRGGHKQEPGAVTHAAQREEEEDGNGDGEQCLMVHRISSLEFTSHVLAVVLLSAAVWLRTATAIGLVDDTEPLFVEAARQMVLTGDWITPQFNAQVRFDKPVLVYWLVALSFQTFGVSELSARLPSILSGVAIVILLALAQYKQQQKQKQKQKAHHLERTADRFVDRDRDRMHGTWPGKKEKEKEKEKEKRKFQFFPVASYLFFLSPGSVVWGAVAVTDMVFVALITSSVLCFYMNFCKVYFTPDTDTDTDHQDKQRSRRNSSSSSSSRLGFLSSALLAGLSFLCKGPLGPLIISLTLALFILVMRLHLNQTATKEAHQTTVMDQNENENENKWKDVLFTLVPWPSMAVIFAFVSLPWFIYMAILHGAMYLNVFLGYHHMSRYFTGVNWHGNKPLWFSFAMILAISFPWSLHLVMHQVGQMKALVHLFLLRLLRGRGTRTRSTVVGKPAFALWKRRRASHSHSLNRPDPLDALSWCWIFAVMLILCPSATQLPSYYLPLLPPLCLLCGNQMANHREASLGCSVTTAASVLLLGMGLCAAPSLLQTSTDTSTARFGAALAESTRYPVVGATLACSALLFAGFAVVSDRKSIRQEEEEGKGGIKGNPLKRKVEGGCEGVFRRCIPPIISVLLFVTFGFQQLIADFDSVRQYPLRSLCQHAVFREQPDAAVASIGLQMPSCVYYTRRPVAFFDTFSQAASELERMRMRRRRRTKNDVKTPPLLFLVSSENYKNNVQKHFVNRLPKDRTRNLKIIAKKDGYLLFQL